MEKLKIQNRKGQRVVVVVEVHPEQKGLSFVMHGLGGFKEQPHIQTYAKTLKDNGYTVVTFDTTNTFGESDGKYEDATATNYYEDLEDVIEWTKTQEWYQEPFVLIGHSLGGICTAQYAERHPERVKAVAPTSTVVSGALSLTTYDADELEAWKKTGWLAKPSISKPGVIKRLKWSHMEDRLRYDLLPDAHKLTMPVLLIVGENDENTPPEHQKLLFDAIPGPKELHVIKGAGHTFREQKHLEEIYQIFDHWLKSFS